MPSTKPSIALTQLPAIDQKLYQALKADIELRGILVPLVYCAKTMTVIDGKVRLMIADQRGIRSIPKIFIGNLSGTEKDEVRIVLNGLRRQLSREQLATVITWALKKSPEVSDREIGRRVGADHSTVSKARAKLEATGEIHQSTKRIGKDGRKRPSSHKPMVFTAHTSAANEASKALDKLGDTAPSGVSSVRKLRRLVMQQDRESELRKSGPQLPSHFDLRASDFRNAGIKSGIADLIIADPPWHTNKELRVPFAQEVFRILKPGGYLLIYSGNQALLDFGSVLQDAGMTWRWIIACINADNNGSVRNNGSCFACWRPVALYQKGGNFRTPSIFRDVLKTVERSKRWHDWEQPLEECIEFVKSFSKPGQLIVDLTMGSGTTAEAVARVGGARRFTGVEIRPELVELAKRRVAAALK